jgi:hypothetical protein
MDWAHIMKLILKLLKLAVIVIAILFIAAQFFRPAKTNPAVDETQTIQAHTQMTPQVAAIIDRSCRDCHSNKTVWPWYSNVAPVSWLVIPHVDDGRRAMNLSEWGHYDQRKQAKRLEGMCDEVTDGGMPLGSYTPMHPGSKLTPADIKTLCDWTKAENARHATP